jgi:hypothetical protein
LHQNLSLIGAEVVRLAPWQRGKLTRQAQVFGLEKLRKSYGEIFQIDLKNKSGLLPIPLKSSIDIWLSNL